MIWATFRSRYYFCWLNITSPSLDAKNVINLILVLTISWHLHVKSSLLLLEEGFCCDQCILLAKLVSLCPALFCTPRTNLPVIPCISWLPAFSFQSPMMKKTSSLVLVLEGLAEPINFSFCFSGWCIDLNYCDIEWFVLEMNRDHSVIFEIVPKYCI